MPHSGGTASYPFMMPLVYDAVARALANLGWRVKYADRSSGCLIASISFSMLSWGEDVQIQLTESSPGQTWVSVSSSSKLAIVDWGKNQKNIDRLFYEIYSVIGATAVLPDSYESISCNGSLPTTCRRCGALCSSTQNFCASCGDRIPVHPDVPPREESGTPSLVTCPACGTENHADSRFCAGCGRSFHPSAS